MRARVAFGPFKDLKGQLQAPPRPGRAALRICALGRQTTLEIDDCLLQRIKGERPTRPCSDRRRLFGRDLES